jgi:hypothetical protein
LILFSTARGKRKRRFDFFRPGCQAPGVRKTFARRLATSPLSSSWSSNPDSEPDAQGQLSGQIIDVNGVGFKTIDNHGFFIRQWRHSAGGTGGAACWWGWMCSKFFQYIPGVNHQLGPLFDQAMGADTFKRVDVPGNGKDLPVLLGGQAGGDQRTASPGGLHHHRAVAHAADDAVAGRKMVRVGTGV